MQAEIISIGTELTSGEKLDTNSQWLSLELSAIGIPVRFHTTMADDKSAMLEVFRTAAQRSDLVLVTGGLGPTLDDLTRELIAELVNVELVLHEPSLQFIKELFAKRNRDFPDRNRIQAMFPAGSEPILNPIGTAPGIWIEIAREGRTPCWLAAMPGVPSEMKKMFREQVAARLPRGTQVIRRVCIHSFGKGESAVEEMLGELTARNRNPEVGITASAATITLRIAAYGSSIEECEQMIDADRRFIHERLGNIIFGEDDDTLEDTTMKLLQARGLTIACAEVGTQGMLSQALATSSPPHVFRGGEVLAATNLTTSENAATKMAQTCREKFDTDFALAVTPFQPPQQPGDAALAYLAVASRDHVEVVEHRILSDLSIAKPRAAKTIIDLLRRHLVDH